MRLLLCVSGRVFLLVGSLVLRCCTDARMLSKQANKRANAKSHSEHHFVGQLMHSQPKLLRADLSYAGGNTERKELEYLEEIGGSMRQTIKNCANVLSQLK